MGWPERLAPPQPRWQLGKGTALIPEPRSLQVADLKEELKKRGLPVSGKKAELAERLETFVQANEVSYQ